MIWAKLWGSLLLPSWKEKTPDIWTLQKIFSHHSWKIYYLKMRIFYVTSRQLLKISNPATSAPAATSPARLLLLLLLLLLLPLLLLLMLLLLLLLLMLLLLAASAHCNTWVEAGAGVEAGATLLNINACSPVHGAAQVLWRRSSRVWAHWRCGAECWACSGLISPQLAAACDCWAPTYAWAVAHHHSAHLNVFQVLSSSEREKMVLL